jgi:phosphoribosylformylglycinamidine cyclo-ligase
MSRLRYEDTGVAAQEGALASVKRYLGATLELSGARPLTGFGHYASVLELAPGLALALCTDGVGTKTVVAAALDRYETIGFDCVAMNVNDLLCVGARPLALVDYLGVHTLDEDRVGRILQGLAAAAAEAGISVPGGEIAQLPDVIGSDGRGPGDPLAFDLVGTCVGTLAPDDLLTGDAIGPGDAVVGIASSGIHSNGLTLARRVLAGPDGAGLYGYREELGRTVGEELLEPTLIYVRPVSALWAAGIRPHGLAHITGDGLANLGRLNPRVGYRIDGLFDIPPVFSLIQDAGDVSTEEMFHVFNMGVGFVAIVSGDQVGESIATISASGHAARPLGEVTDEAGVVRVTPADLVWHAH